MTFGATVFSEYIVTSKERNDIVLDIFRRIGLRRWIDGINPPSKRKEYIVTITNHIRRIEELSGGVIHLVDARDYENAHMLLDEIEKKVRAAHRHIDHLQNVTDFCARPAGVNVT